MLSSDKASAAVAERGTLVAPGRIGARLVGLIAGQGDQHEARRGAATAFAVRVASAGLLYLSQIVLARWMGGFEYGVYVFVWTWVLVLGGLSNLGMATLMIRLVPVYRERGETDLLRGLLRTGRLLPVIAATIIAAAAGASLYILGDLISRPYVLPAFIALACVPLVALSDIHDGIGRGRGWLVDALVPPYVLRPLLVLLGMVLAHGAGLPMSAVTAAGVAVAGTWIAAILQVVLVERRLRREVPRGGARSDVRGWLATSLPLLAITFSEILVQNTDVLVVSQLMSPHDVALYFAAAKTMSLVMFVHYAVGSAMANRFASLNARGDREGLARSVREAVSWTFWPSLAAAALILALGKPLLWLFGPQFMDGYPVMLVLAAGFLARAATGPAELLLNMLGLQRASACVAMTVASLDIGLNLLLVPRHGLMGAAMATALSLAFGAALNTIIAKRWLGLSIGIWSNAGRGRGPSQA
ncbi:MAG: lipopolysaccharide biosynthesis protein [Hyphomicrobiaceae bacterium]